MQSSSIPLVSVIIPMYNSEKYIGITIKSILQQTYSNIEVLVVNDGSKDNSLAKAKEWQSEKVKVYDKPNGGASSARNYGLRIAKGEYIQFLDADDYLSENKIEEQVKLLIENPRNVAVCATIHFFDNELPNYDSRNIEWFEEVEIDPLDFLITLYGGNPEIPGTMIQPNAWLTPKAIIDKAGYWNEDFKINPDDDGEFFCRVILESSGISFTKNGYNFYRKFKNGQSLSSMNNQNGLETRLAMAKLKAHHILQKTSKESAKRALSRNYMELALMSYPRYYGIYKSAYSESKKLFIYNGHFYTYTPVYKFITKVFGWKVSAWLAYIKKESKQIISFR